MLNLCGFLNRNDYASSIHGVCIIHIHTYIDLLPHKKTI